MVLRRLGFLFAALVVVLACGGGGFDPVSKVNSVRVLGIRADKPYAKPGDAVTVEALVHDGRSDKSEPMQFVWLPFVCMNPPQDLYYACFLPLSDGSGGAGAQTPVTILDPNALADGGTDGGAMMDGGGPSVGSLPLSISDLLSRVPPGLDLTPFLPRGPKFAFRMPLDAVDTHPPVEGVTERYGMAIVFFMACAGKIQFAAADPNAGPQQIPLACIGPDGNRRGANDYVFGVERIYAYEDEVNTNPVLERITHNGAPIDLTTGISVPKCVGDKMQCPKQKIDVAVPESSWEENKGDLDLEGKTLREQIWVSYFVTEGELGSDARLLYDSRVGKITGSEVEYTAPSEPMTGTMWLVVRDSRGGANWASFPFTITD